MNLHKFYRILATIQHFEFRKFAVMDQFVTFHKMVYIQTGICPNRLFMTREKHSIYENSMKNVRNLTNFRISSMTFRVVLKKNWKPFIIMDHWPEVFRLDS